MEKLRAGEDITTVKAMGASCSDLDVCTVLDLWLTDCSALKSQYFTICHAKQKKCW